MNPHDFIESIRQILLALAFPDVGEIVKFDANSRRATIRLLTRSVYDDDTEEERIDIYNIPIYYPRFGPFSMTGPLNEGDEVLVIFTGRDIDLFKQNGGRHTPADSRILHWTDGLAIPWGMSGKKVANFTNSFFMGKSDQSVGIEITADDKISIGTSSAELVALFTDLSEQVESIAGTLATMGIITSSGTGKVDPVAIKDFATARIAAAQIKNLIKTIKK